MKISRKYVSVLTIVLAGVGFSLAVLLALFAGVGAARAYTEEGSVCEAWTDPDGTEYWECCTYAVSVDESTGHVTVTQTCHGSWTEMRFGCRWVQWAGECMPNEGCHETLECIEFTGGSIWLADVCEPNDGFSDAGQMTWDSNHSGPLLVGASMGGEWYEVQVNGPPWVVTEEMMDSFAAMVGVHDWHDLWLRSGDGYPQQVEDAIAAREGHMDALCNP